MYRVGGKFAKLTKKINKLLLLVGVVGYEVKIVKKLSKNLKSSLPSVQEIEDELEKQEIVSGKQKIKTGTKA